MPDASVAAVVVACALGAAIGLVGAPPAGGVAGASLTAASSAPKVMTCAGTGVTRPSTYTITCADGYTYLQPIHWTIWGPGGARATATFRTNTCEPSCVAGTSVHYPARVSLSRARATPYGRLFTELTVAYTVGGATRHYATSLPTTPIP